MFKWKPSLRWLQWAAKIEEETNFPGFSGRLPPKREEDIKGVKLTQVNQEVNLDKLYPKWNCGVCGDWFHMPYKFCKCGKTQKDIDWSKVSEKK